MVDLPSGKMKSREGTVVDADDLIRDMAQTAEAISEELGKLDAYSEKEKGDKPHYKDQKTSLKGTPKKKAKYKDDKKNEAKYSFAEFLENRELCECEGNKMCAKCKARKKKRY